MKLSDDIKLLNCFYNVVDSYIFLSITVDISITEEFKSGCKAPYVWGPFPGTLTSKDEALLIDLLYDIIGNEGLNDEMQGLLRLSNDFEELDIALKYEQA